MLDLDNFFSYCASALVCQPSSIKQTMNSFIQYNIQDQHSGIFNLNSNQQGSFQWKRKQTKTNKPKKKIPTKTNPPNFLYHLNENMETLSITPTFSHNQEIGDCKKIKGFYCSRYPTLFSTSLMPLLPTTLTNTPKQLDQILWGVILKAVRALSGKKPSVWSAQLQDLKHFPAFFHFPDVLQVSNIWA